MLKLSQEEREALHTLLQQEGYKALVKVLDACQADLEAAVLSYNLETGEAQKLLLTKARAEGAKKLMHNFKTYIAAEKAKK